MQFDFIQIKGVNSLFKKFLDSYIDVCNNIVTEAANSVLMFEAGEQAAMNTKTLRIEDIYKEFEKDGIVTAIEISDKKVTFHVKGLPLVGNKCKYCDFLRGFFGGLARKHLDPRYYCGKGAECVIEGGSKCTFVAELIE